MAPVPDPSPNPKPINVLEPVQHNWDKIDPWLGRYNQVLGGLGTVFGFASAIALIASHGFKPPKWPFTSERWNPKPNVEKDEEEKAEEVTEEDLVEDELADVAAAGLAKRELHQRELNFEHDFFSDDYFYLEKRGELDDILDDVEQGFKEISEDVKEATKDAVEKGKEIYEDAKPGIDEIVEGAKKVGSTVWDDVTDVFDHHKNKTVNGTASNRNESAPAQQNSKRAFIFFDNQK